MIPFRWRGTQWFCKIRPLSLHRNMSSKFRQRAVVSSFICTPPESSSGLTFALFKRSEKVSTYKGKWAVCSGSIDPADVSPISAARREIQEETQLDENDICLFRKGKPFSLIDEALNTEWTIHPFAFRLKETAKPIVFDWEHTEYQFVKPEELGRYDHVPQLEIGMKRVLVSPEVEKGLSILQNRQGDDDILRLSMEALAMMVNGEEMSRISSTEKFWNELSWRAWHLIVNGQPSLEFGTRPEDLSVNIKDEAGLKHLAILAVLHSIDEQIRFEGGIEHISLTSLKHVAKNTISTSSELKNDSQYAPRRAPNNAENESMLSSKLNEEIFGDL